ncbi:glycosyltransferase family 2 protein [Halopseudomonas phragmitis]|uniref:Glycosyltransferase 2-like domain-containing protein n=1 Tax=Halopseudomonas phragmitis TaxID=1931241 RepID=A0A1V0B5S1_9GAMM|nr:glycosyltransferase family 2 protein [Halopseudomonas phragmitis]AQZ95276.1 hypothetical protein BVH74_11160 [Halopseudomonas phragmitis]
MGKPVFSVVTVVRNAKESLQKTIDSVLSQVFDGVEYIIVDGGSTDGTLDVIKKNTSEVSAWISEPDSGIYEAMNKGVSLATGQWVSFMNAGDVFVDEFVLSKVAESLKGDAGVMYGDRYYVTANDGRVLQRSKPVTTIFERMPFGHQAAFVRRDILKIFGFNETYKFAADYDLFVRLYMQGVVFEFVDFPICEFEAGGLSESGLRPYLEVLKVLLDNTSDKEVISRNVYFKKFLEVGRGLALKVVE